MKPVNVNTCFGFDLSMTKDEAHAQMKILERQICSFFTDDFRCYIGVPLVTDAVVTVRPSIGKVEVMEHPPTQDYNSDRPLWRCLVLASFKEKLNKDYGYVPFKEANDVIRRLKSIKEPIVKLDSPVVEDNNSYDLSDRLKSVLGGSNFAQYLKEHGFIVETVDITGVTKHQKTPKAPKTKERAPQSTSTKGPSVKRVIQINLDGLHTFEQIRDVSIKAFERRNLKVIEFTSGYNVVFEKSDGTRVITTGNPHATRPNYMVFVIK